MCSRCEMGFHVDEQDREQGLLNSWWISEVSKHTSDAQKLTQTNPPNTRDNVKPTYGRVLPS